jgi:hypothetical protein
MSNSSHYDPNLQQYLVNSIGELEDKLEDFKVKVGDNEKVKKINTLKP